MGLINLVTTKKKFTFLDIALDEIAMIAFAFLIAKYWISATSLDWYWYAIIGVLAIIKPIISCFKE